MAFSFGASAYPQQQAAPQGAAPQNNDQFMQLMAQMLQGQQQPQFDITALAKTLLGRPQVLGHRERLARPDVQGEANRSTQMASYMPGNASPFNTGFFGAKPGSAEFSGRTTAFDPEAAQETQRQVSGMPGMLPVMPPTGRQVADPFDETGGLMPGVNPNALASPSYLPMMPPSRSTNQISGGFEGMINPQLPQDQLYKDPNFFSVLPNQSSLPSGAVAGDGTTSYRRKKTKPAMPTPSFNFR